MYPPRAPNVRMKFDELPGPTPESISRAGARVSYRSSANPVLKESDLSNKNPQELRTPHGTAEPTRPTGTLKLPD